MATNENNTRQTAAEVQAAADPSVVTKKDRMLIFTIITILVILAALAIFGFLCIKQGPDTVQGQADATELRISGKLPGRVAEIFVEEYSPH